MQALDEKGWSAPSPVADAFSTWKPTHAATELYGEVIRRIVKDPQTAASLVPHYPFGCKRVIIDVGYFETFNRDNVTLVDLRKDPIDEITPTGIQTAGRTRSTSTSSSTPRGSTR